MKIKKQKGISLIVLVVTIVVMLIIVGSSLGAIFDYEGIMQSSQKAKEVQENYANSEDEKTNNLINILDNEMGK